MFMEALYKSCQMRKSRTRLDLGHFRVPCHWSTFDKVLGGATARSSAAGPRPHRRDAHFGGLG